MTEWKNPQIGNSESKFRIPAVTENNKMSTERVTAIAKSVQGVMGFVLLVTVWTSLVTTVAHILEIDSVSLGDAILLSLTLLFARAFDKVTIGDTKIKK